jgi:hypothetical protein
MWFNVWWEDQAQCHGAPGVYIWANLNTMGGSPPSLWCNGTGCYGVSGGVGYHSPPTSSHAILHLHYEYPVSVDYYYYFPIPYGCDDITIPCN